MNETAARPQVQRVALVSSRALYWHTPNTRAPENADRLAELIRLVATMPDIMVGVDPSSAGTVLWGLADTSEEHLPDDVSASLQRIGIFGSDVPTWPSDSQHFGRHRQELEAIVADAPTDGGLVWRTAAEVDWWLNASVALIKEYSIEISSGDREQAELREYFDRHSMVFSGRHGGATLQQALLTLANGAAERHHKPVREADGSTFPDDLYWTWDLSDFRSNRGNLFCILLLTTWNTPPVTRWFSPVTLDSAARPGLTSLEAARLLEHEHWTVVETAFLEVLFAVGLRFAEPEVDSRSVQAPLFFFADLSEPTSREKLLEAEDTPIRDLAEVCLGAADPLAEDVGWGLVHGNLLTARREHVRAGYYRPRYLITPVGSASQDHRASEFRLRRFASALSFFEFTIGDEARDLLVDIEGAVFSLSKQGEFLSALAQLAVRATSMLPILRGREVQHVHSQIRSMSLLLGRLQARVDLVGLHVGQTRLNHTAYLDSTEDYLRRTLTLATIVVPKLPSLRDALLDAYPYHYVRVPLDALERGFDSLAPGVERVRRITTPILDDADRAARRRLESAARWFGFLGGLFALLITLPQFIPGAALTTATYPAWLQQIVPLGAVEGAARVLVGLAIATLVVVSGAFGLNLVLERLGAYRQPFRDDLRRLRDLVLQAERLRGQRASVGLEATGEALEQLDASATSVLCRLLDRLIAARDASLSHTTPTASRSRWRPDEASDWIQSVGYLTMLVELFDEPPLVELPRTECLFRLKSGEFLNAPALDEGLFKTALRRSGFSDNDTDRLISWLSQPVNRESVANSTPTSLTAALARVGVSASESLRTPELWASELKVDQVVGL